MILILTLIKSEVMKEKSHLIFVRTKGGIAENFGRIQKGRPQICLEDEFMGRGGMIAKVIKSY